MLGRAFMPAVVNANNTTENATTRIVTGVDGQLGEKWSWDAYYQHGENENHQRLFHNLVGTTSGNPSRQYELPALGSRRRGQPGQSDARSFAARRYPAIPTFNANAAGCVPLNILGNTSANPAADRLRVPHAQGGQRVQAGRARRQLPQHARRGVGRADRVRDRARVAKGPGRHDARSRESAVVLVVLPLVRSRSRRRHRRDRRLRRSPDPDDEEAADGLRDTRDEQRSDQRDELGHHGLSRLLELEGGRDLRPGRVAAVSRDALARRSRAGIPRAVPAACHGSVGDPPTSRIPGTQT